MLFKLAIRNVRKSFKDYSIYFITLVLAIALFYAFNSFDSLGLIQVDKYSSENLKNLNEIMHYLSIFIAVILGFLICYASAFLIRKRKKEMGTYLLLGMRNLDISKILMYETLVVSMVACLVGILVGWIGAQFLFSFTKTILEVGVPFTLTFSTIALQNTLLSFGVIFLISLLVNIVIVRRTRLISLLKAAKKPNVIQRYQLYVAPIIFIISIVGFVQTYRMGLYDFNETFELVLIVGAISTIGFFYSFSTMMVFLLKRIRRFYYQHVRMFSVQELSATIHSNFLSLSMVCLMLLVGIAALGVGISLNEVLGKMAEDQRVPYDVTFSQRIYINEYYEVSGSSEDEEYTKATIDIEEAIDNLWLNDSATKEAYKLSIYEVKDIYHPILRESEYQSSMKAIGKQAQAIPNDYDGLVLHANSLSRGDYSSDREYYLKSYTYQGKPLSFYSGEQDDLALAPNLFLGQITFANDILVLPDDMVDGLMVDAIGDTPYPEVVSTIYGRNFVDATTDPFVYEEQMRLKESKLIKDTVNEYQAKGLEFSEDEFEYLSMSSHAVQEVYLIANTGMTKILATFVGLYIGIAFIIASLLILAIQTISKAYEQQSQFSIMRKIGVTKKQLRASIRMQTMIYFFLPLSLAAVHLYFAFQTILNLGLFTKEYYGVFFDRLSIVLVMVFALYLLYYLLTIYMFKRGVQEKVTSE